MTSGGWITFLLSISGFTFLFSWCVYKVLTAKNPNKIHGIENTEEMEEDIQPRHCEPAKKGRKQ